MLSVITMVCVLFPGEEGVGGGGGGGGKQRHNSSDKNIREYFSKHPSSSPVRHAGAKSPSPQGANYPMVSILHYFNITNQTGTNMPTILSNYYNNQTTMDWAL